MSATLIVPSLRPVPGYAGNKIDHLSRLAKVEGQVRDIARMPAHRHGRADLG